VSGEWLEFDGRGVSVNVREARHLELAFATRCAALIINENITVRDMSTFQPRYPAELKRLEIHCSIGTNLPNLAGCNLIRLVVSQSALQDISGLRGAKVSEVDIHGTLVQSLSPLRDTGIRWLDISDTGVTSLNDIAGEPLDYLRMDGIKVKDISSLRALRLTAFSARHTPIMSLGALRQSRLLYVDIMGTQVTDLTPLTGQPLEQIWLDFWRVRDGWAAVMRCDTLETLNGEPAQEVIEYWRPLLADKMLRAK
jgi:hypothetical protein